MCAFAEDFRDHGNHKEAGGQAQLSANGDEGGASHVLPRAVTRQPDLQPVQIWGFKATVNHSLICFEYCTGLWTSVWFCHFLGGPSHNQYPHIWYASRTRSGRNKARSSVPHGALTDLCKMTMHLLDVITGTCWPTSHSLLWMWATHQQLVGVCFGIDMRFFHSFCICTIVHLYIPYWPLCLAQEKGALHVGTCRLLACKFRLSAVSPKSGTRHSSCVTYPPLVLRTREVAWRTGPSNQFEMARIDRGQESVMPMRMGHMYRRKSSPQSMMRMRWLKHMGTCCHQLHRLVRSSCLPRALPSFRRVHTTIRDKSLTKRRTSTTKEW